MAENKLYELENIKSMAEMVIKLADRLIERERPAVSTSGFNKNVEKFLSKRMKTRIKKSSASNTAS